MSSFPQARFDGAVEDLIGAWASGKLPPRKRKQDSISIRVVPFGPDGELRVLYSYAEAIAAMYATWGSDDSRFVVVKDEDALQRASMTTKKHLTWTHRQLRGQLGWERVSPLEFGPLEELVFLRRGEIPTTPEEWFKFGHYMTVVRAVPDETLRGLWRAYEREPWDEGIWAVLRDAYAERGFGERQEATYGRVRIGVQLDPVGSAFELYESTSEEAERAAMIFGFELKSSASWDAIVR